MASIADTLRSATGGSTIANGRALSTKQRSQYALGALLGNSKIKTPSLAANEVDVRRRTKHRIHALAMRHYISKGHNYCQTQILAIRIGTHKKRATTTAQPSHTSRSYKPIRELTCKAIHFDHDRIRHYGPFQTPSNRTHCQVSSTKSDWQSAARVSSIAWGRGASAAA